MYAATSTVFGLVVGTSNFTDNFGHWIRLELVSLSQQLRITKDVVFDSGMKIKIQKI